MLGGVGEECMCRCLLALVYIDSGLRSGGDNKGKG